MNVDAAARPAEPTAEATPVHGRSLDTSRDATLMQAALSLVGELGYDNVSMDAIAGRARASKATIYRRWDSKAALVAQALSCRKESFFEVPDTGDLRADLITGLSSTIAHMCDADLALMTGLLTAMRSDAELARLIREQMVTNKRGAARAFIARAVARGQVGPDVDPDLAHEIANAMIFTRLILTGEPADEAFVVRLVDNVLLPVLAHPYQPFPEGLPES